MGRAAQLRTKIIIVGLVIATGLGSLGVYKLQQNNTPPASQPVVEQTVVQSTTNLQYQGEDGKTALELLRTKAEVVTKDSSFGEYVTTINGNDGGGTKYWLFYVNGQQSNVGADAYKTKSTDQIEWRLE